MPDSSLSPLPVIVIDVANVLGARGDGWWKDIPGASARLLRLAAELADRGVPGSLFGGGDELVPVELVAVLEGRARRARPQPGASDGEADGTAGPRSRLTTPHAPGLGDDEIVEQARRLIEGDPSRPVLVATSDRQLRNRVAELGVGAIGGGRMRDLLEPAEHGR
ncbi:hypothetical protein GCM10011490_12250 [Pseudoclavibacter endophyticus]|uniref:hypothetical protein n=1 Tax=Pseudoclavibacter endophyticus TaxID=1778590 RepID=UPI0016637182|nr:hypothetical protein [Pseudoclavibacter endophyticus]GGA63224.1 hypothetical protein GCM10011490_12250 [Pseudoclavibacter endophyticus]